MAPKFKTLQVGGLVMGERKEYLDQWRGTRFPAFTTLWLVEGREEEWTPYGTRYTFHLKKIYNSRKPQALESGQAHFLDYQDTIITDSQFTISSNGGTREVMIWSIV